MKIKSMLTTIATSSWMRAPVAVLSLTIAGTIAFLAGLIDFVVLLIGVAILLVAQLVALIGALRDVNSGNANSMRRLVMIAIVIVIPILLILNIKTIDYAGAFLVVWLTEPHLLRKAETSSVNHSDPSSSFKYFRLSLGQFAETKRWVVYDESGQVLLDYQKRNSEWWKVSKEFDEGEACLTNGARLYSHFYIQYSGC